MALSYKDFRIKESDGVSYYKYNNLIILGTSHISQQSIKSIDFIAKKFSPKAIAVELDPNRLYALAHKQRTSFSLKQIREFGLTGFLFSVIGGFAQRKLGKIVGIEPGSDMLEAVKKARELKIELHLIDRDIRATLQSLSKNFSSREKWRLVKDIIKGIIFRKDIIKFDLNKVPEEELIEMLLRKLKDRYKGLYKALINERNVIMASKLFVLMNSGKEIFAVVGAGHVEGIMDIILQTDKRYYE
jgi:pheromone shutdown-related protein TraB